MEKKAELGQRVQSKGDRGLGESLRWRLAGGLVCVEGLVGLVPMDLMPVDLDCVPGEP